MCYSTQWGVLFPRGIVSVPPVSLTVWVAQYEANVWYNIFFIYVTKSQINYFLYVQGYVFTLKEKWMHDLLKNGNQAPKRNDFLWVFFKGNFRQYSIFTVYTDYRTKSPNKDSIIVIVVQGFTPKPITKRQYKPKFVTISFYGTSCWLKCSHINCVI